MGQKAVPLVLDSWAVLAWLQGEPAGREVAEILASALEAKRPALLSVANAAEVWYITARETSAKEADSALHEILQLGIELADLDWTVGREAAGFKSRYRISLADGFAAALAKIQNGELLTGDPEFKPLNKEVRLRFV